ncbi:hypothetical protein JAAARDRAFT_37480 [Jaapia argillacea MUCL 33604]|uniref:Uncharacterized protein n=1 Tax=Jaapia argillacea MUCL 33604 TaxID=933084 RepID=A0A067PW30_9AGAM|nr:hypothetical protein JAAARDRAFT_37480 [Jaapia argillacea MUCL 33604]
MPSSYVQKTLAYYAAQDSTPPIDFFSLKYYLSQASLHPLILDPSHQEHPPSVFPSRTKEVRSWEGFEWCTMRRERGERVLKVVAPMGGIIPLRTTRYLAQTPDAQINWNLSTLKLPAPQILNLSTAALKRLHVSSLETFATAFQTSVLCTVEAVLGMFDEGVEVDVPSAVKFEHAELEDEVKGAPWDVYTLVSRSHTDTSQPIKKTHMLLITLPPWSFTTTDFTQFSSFHNFRGDVLNRGSEPIESWTPVLALWALLYDLCLELDCRFFTVTSYDNWVFGNFSESMQTARQSNIHTRHSHTPNITQMFVFWSQISRGLGRWELPKVCTLFPLEGGGWRE